MSDASTPLCTQAPMDKAMLDAQAAASFAWCHEVTRRQARNFYYGLKLTPQPHRSAGYAIYAFMRACDDLADMDAPGDTPAQCLERIERFRGQMKVGLGEAQGEAPQGEYWPAFCRVARQYALEPALFHAMLDGQRSDVLAQHYESFEQLYDYCYQVAGVVGLVCIGLWGAGDNPQARLMAEQRGVGLQLTNILRDLVEDAQRGRVYLPAQELREFGYPTPLAFGQAILGLHAGGAGGEAKSWSRFDALMRFQIDRASTYYKIAEGLEPLVQPPFRATSWALMHIYRELLGKIAAHPRRVLAGRVRLSSWRKLGIGLRAAWMRKARP